MAIDYARANATAQRLIASSGMSVTWRSLTRSGGEFFNPSTATHVDRTVSAVRVPIKRIGKESVTQSKTAQPTINACILVAGQDGFAPKKHDVVIIEGVTFTVQSFKELNPAGVSIYYSVELSR